MANEDVSTDEMFDGDSVDVKPLLEPDSKSDSPTPIKPRLSSSDISVPVLSYSRALAARTMPAMLRQSCLPVRDEGAGGDMILPSAAEPRPGDNQRTVVLAKEQTELVLKEQLRQLQEELMLKDSECAKMHAYRDRVAGELEDLTATLFEEANKMVRDEKIKRHKAEKLYQETHMKLEALQTEMLWRREQMSLQTKSSSLPHRSASLHVLNGSSFPTRNDGSSDSLSIGNVLQWFRGSKPSTENPTVHLSGESAEDGAVVRKETDPIVHAEFVLWRQKPSLGRDHALINRIYLQEIEPNFEFVNLELSRRVLQAVENNTVYIEEGSKYKPFAKICSLSCSPRSCIYRMKINDDNTWYPISAFARNRITSVCDFFTYIRYIQLGLVRRGVHDTWWEIVGHREKMSKARLGIL